jgi:hypothetical protein
MLLPLHLLPPRIATQHLLLLLMMPCLYLDDERVIVVWMGYDNLLSSMGTVATQILPFIRIGHLCAQVQARKAYSR